MLTKEAPAVAQFGEMCYICPTSGSRSFLISILVQDTALGSGSIWINNTIKVIYLKYGYTDHVKSV